MKVSLTIKTDFRGSASAWSNRVSSVFFFFMWSDLINATRVDQTPAPFWAVYIKTVFAIFTVFVEILRRFFRGQGILKLLGWSQQGIAAADRVVPINMSLILPGLKYIQFLNDTGKRDPLDENHYLPIDNNIW